MYDGKERKNKMRRELRNWGNGRSSKERTENCIRLKKWGETRNLNNWKEPEWRR